MTYQVHHISGEMLIHHHDLGKGTEAQHHKTIYESPLLVTCCPIIARNRQGRLVKHWISCFLSFYSQFFVSYYLLYCVQGQGLLLEQV